MEFTKNDTLINTICLVQIKSIDAVVEIPALTTIYHTPSKISFSISNKQNAAGVLINKKLSLAFPGLSTEDFTKFSNLVRGAFQVFIKTTSNDIYEVASQAFFMSCSTSFNLNSGHTLNFESSSPIAVKFRDNQTQEGINIDGFDYEFDFYLS